jgi:hypothetical protein
VPAFFYRGLFCLRPLSLTALAILTLLAGSCLPWSGATELRAGDLRLAADGDDVWTLTQVYHQVFRHERGARQPGEPRSSSFEFDNPGGEQSLQWILTAEGGEVSDVSISVDAMNTVQLPVRLAQGWSVRYEGGTTATVRDANNRRVRSLIVAPGDFRIESGRHAVSLDSSLKPDQEARARLELRPSGETERVAANVGGGGQTREE